MSTMNISLPEALKEFVDKQVAERGFASTSEYLRELIRREYEIAVLREKILEGGRSPVVATADKAYFENLRKSLRARHKA